MPLVDTLRSSFTDEILQKGDETKLAIKTDKLDAPKRRVVVYYHDGPNGIQLKAEDEKEDIEALNQWLRSHIELPKGKHYDFGAFVIPHNEWPAELYARLLADFEVRPLAENYGWTATLDEIKLLKKALDGLGFEYSDDPIVKRMTVFLKKE